MILVCTATDCSCGNRKNGICSTDANTHMRKSHDICTESYICMYLDVRMPEVDGMSTDIRVDESRDSTSSEYLRGSTGPALT